ncbi:MAG: PAS domain S-box protein [Ignavibacteriales bacterium]|nr:PAS domain S-box protein [Ignavibacteriales bacterium]
MQDLKFDISAVSDFCNFLQDVACILDTDGNILDINNAACFILGYAKEELAGKNINKLHPSSNAIDFTALCELLKAHQPASHAAPLVTSTNKLIPAETRFFFGSMFNQSVIISLSRDMSDVRRTQDMFSKIFDQSHMMMAIMEADSGKIINVNPQFERMLGYKKADVTGMRVTDLLLATDIEKLIALKYVLEKNGFVRDYELSLNSTQGYITDILLSIYKIVIQGTEYHWLSANDITSTKTTAGLLKNLLIQTQLIADISLELNNPREIGKSLAKVIAFLGEHTNVSRVYIFEDSFDGETTNNTYEWCNTGITPRKQNLQQIPYSTIPSWKPILTKKGKLFSCNISGLPEDIKKALEPQQIQSILVYPIYIDNSFRGFIGFNECTRQRNWPVEEIDLLRTVSNVIANALERKNFFEQLQENQFRLQLTIDSAREGLWDWNIKTGAIKYSDFWCSMLGYAPDEIEANLGTWEKMLHPDDKESVFKILNGHLAGERDYYEAVHRIKTKQGSWRWILDHGKVIERNEANEPIRALGTHIDITKQKETENELVRLIATKDKFFSIIAHDLKNPFMTLLSLTELMLLCYDDFSAEEIKENLNEIFTVTKSTHTLLENLLTWARSQRGDIKLHPETLSLNLLAQETISQQSTTALKKLITLHNDIPVGINVYCDSDTVLTILRNLVANAIKFSKPDGIITVSAHDDGGFVAVSITDNGVGMNQETMDKLFRIDVHHSTEGTGHEKGTGLGLILCKEFAESNGGKISVSSIEGQGSTFTFTLPQKAQN